MIGVKTIKLNTKRPILLTVVAIIWFLTGLIGVIAAEIRSNKLQLDYNFLNILVGVGLLSYWRIARWYALFVTGCIFVFMLMFLPWTIFNSAQIVFNFPAILIEQRPHPALPLIAVLLVCLTYLIASGFCFWTLAHRDVHELFASKSPRKSPVPAI